MYLAMQIIFLQIKTANTMSVDMIFSTFSGRDNKSFQGCLKL